MREVRRATAEYSDIIRKLPYLDHLCPEDANLLTQIGIIAHYSREATIFREGDSAGHFYLVVSGWVKLYRETSDGREAVLDVVNNGVSLNGISASGSAYYGYHAEAASQKVTILEIPLPLLQEKLERHGKLALLIASLISEQANLLRSRIESLTVNSAEERISGFLCMLAALNESAQFQLPYPKALLAMQLGMKPETFSRALKALVNKGIHVRGNNVTLKEAAFAQCSVASVKEMLGDKKPKVRRLALAEIA